MNKQSVLGSPSTSGPAIKPLVPLGQAGTPGGGQSLNALAPAGAKPGMPVKPGQPKPNMFQNPAQPQPQPPQNMRRPSVVAQLGRAQGGVPAVMANVHDMFNAQTQPKVASVLDSMIVQCLLKRAALSRFTPRG